MDVVTLVTGLIGGLGIGSIVQSVVTKKLEKESVASERNYREKREAYLGLFDAMHRADVEPSWENAKSYGLWRIRVGLVGALKLWRLPRRSSKQNLDLPSA